MTLGSREFFPGSADSPTSDRHSTDGRRPLVCCRRGMAMKQDERVPFVDALHRARVGAYPPGEFVEQESFMRAVEIRELAEQGGIVVGASVRDLGWGMHGPGRFITRSLGCAYLGVDYSPSAIELARQRAGQLSCRFEVAR